MMWFVAAGGPSVAAIARVLMVNDGDQPPKPPPKDPKKPAKPRPKKPKRY